MDMPSTAHRTTAVTTEGEAVTWCLAGACVLTTQRGTTVRGVPRSTMIIPGGRPTATAGSPTRAGSASVTATQTAATSLGGRGSPPVAPVGESVMAADTTPSGAGASGVATATTATQRCPSTPPTHAHAAGVIHRALCQLIRERRGRGVTLEAGSATANTAWAAQAATTAFLAIGVLERGAVNPVRVLATVIQPLDSVCTATQMIRCSMCPSAGGSPIWTPWSQ